MDYHQSIQNALKIHITYLEQIDDKEFLPEKVLEHLVNTIQTLGIIRKKRPKDYKMLIEYLYQEGRKFGWSFPENLEEEKCENKFWEIKKSIKSIIQGMTMNERLYFFGYLDEYEGLNSVERSAREKIELKLFMK